MIKIGMIIGDRYEILEKIGTGGMSDVYKAKDHKLNRAVAIKILKQEFSENANFVSKFRVEAQAAAGLMHANIVNVYDVGEEHGIYYIVMELVEGITLKKYIEKKARLSVKEAISIAIQVSLGIEAAHNNHIIHRDIKPQNIMISKEGRVKVTDFGIAKAATSNTITSNVMGSVHYTSPEQARGGYSDEKSDIYSLGITLFEMLTGRVPFNGETTVAIAIKHIQELMPSPKEYVEEIPVSVEQIVLKCTQKSPDARYQSMGELVEDLKRSLITPDEDFVVMGGVNVDGETKLMSDREVTGVRSQTGRSVPSEQEHMRLNENPHPAIRQRPAAEQRQARPNRPQQRPVRKKEEEEEEYSSKAETVTTVLMVVVAVIIGCIILYIAGRILGVFPLNGDMVQPGEEVTGTPTAGLVDVQTTNTPNINGDNANLTGSGNGERTADVPDVSSDNSFSQAEATKALTDRGFQVEIVPTTSETVLKGYVISQTPAAGEVVPFGSTVTLLVSEGADTNIVVVPTLLGRTREDAEAALNAVELSLGSVNEGFSDEYPAGQVYYQSYSAGGNVRSGTVVDIKISVGPQPHSYTCNVTVNAPDDPQYNGSEATVKLVGSDNNILFNQNTNTFPINVYVAGIPNVSTGQIIIDYTVSVTTTQIDEYGNETTVTTQEARSVTQEVVFIEE